MGNNLEKLDSWYKIISLYEKLDLDTAKKLYIEYQNETNEYQKQIKRDKLIMGTVYVVYKFIKNNNPNYLNSSIYDIDDIINICNEIWIIMIDSGKLLKVNKYCEMFDYQFYSELTEKLVPSKFSIAENTILDTDIFSDFLYKFIEEYNNKGEFTYKDFINLLINRSDDDYKYKKILYKIIWNPIAVSGTYYLLTSIYNSMQKVGEVSITKRKIEMLKYILINNGLDNERQSINAVVQTDPAENIITEMYLTKLKEIIFNECNLTETEIRILKKRYGIDENHSHTLGEIAHEEKLTKERIRQKENKILRKLRQNKKLRNNFNI